MTNIRWKDHDVHCLNDLIDSDQQQLFTFENIKGKLCTNNFIKYCSLVFALRKYIKDFYKRKFSKL